MIKVYFYINGRQGYTFNMKENQIKTTMLSLSSIQRIFLKDNLLEITEFNILKKKL